MSDENQHWVPKFLIRNFADTDGRVFCLDIRTDAVSKPPPKHAASGAAFNEFVISGKPLSFEDKLEKIETAAAPVLKQIVRTGTIAGLTDRHRRQVSNFMAAQSFRTDAFYKGLAFEGSRQDFGAIFAQLWRGAFIISGELMRRRWVLMSITRDDVFYLGDHPLVLQHTDMRPGPSEVGFDIEGVEAMMPLSPKHALWMPCVAIGNELVAAYEAARNNVQECSELTDAQAASLLPVSRRILGRDGPLYEALTTGKPLIASPENVENLNYLQCAWAQAAVYSNRGDFAFAKHVFSKTPQYRAVLKARLAAFGS